MDELRLHGDSDATIRFNDPETGEEYGMLGIVWRPRFFGRWGRPTPRVVFTGDVERSAKQLYQFMLGLIKDREVV